MQRSRAGCALLWNTPVITGALCAQACAGMRQARHKYGMLAVVMLVKQALTFRPCEAVDLPFIIQLSAEALAEYAHRPVSQTLALVSRHRTWVALRGTRRVGFVAIGTHDGVAVLHALAVVPSERGNGVGYRLMQLFERCALQQGSRRLELCTAACNLAALDLFFKRGFRLLTRKARFFAQGQDACVLVKDLRAREQRAPGRDRD